MPDLLTGYHVVSLVGRQGSGKSFLGGKLSALLSCGHLEVSDVVKSLNKDLVREELPGTSKRTLEDPDWLGEKVAECIVAIRNKVGGHMLVALSGARETQVHKYLKRVGATLWVVEIHCNPYTRCERLIRLGKVKDEEGFLAHEVRETRMGITEVLREGNPRVRTSDTSDPDDLMKQLLTSLKKKGVG